MTVWDRLQALIHALTSDAAVAPQAHAPARATVMLLLEVAWADQQIAPNELAQVQQALMRLYDLTASEASALIADAQREHERAVSVQPFTHALNQTLSGPERVELVTELWRLAYCDAQLDKYEDFHIRKIADLLYVSHADFIAAKHLAAGPR